MAQLVVHTGSSAWNTWPAAGDRNFAVSLIFLTEKSVDRTAMKSPPGSPAPPRFRGCTRNSGSYSHSNMAPQHHGRMAQLVGHTDQIGQLKLNTVPHGLLAQLVVPTGTFSRMRDVDVNRLLASRSLESTESSPKNPNILGEFIRNVRIRSHGSVGRAHRSHRWGHRFESCCDHHKTSKA